jgi:hypothetical protein
MKRALIALAAVISVIAAVAALWLIKPDPTGMAIGRIDPAERELHKALWQALEPRGPVFLKAYGDALREPPDDPILLATAFNELAYQVTGRSGIWRKTLPDDFFGCPANPENPVCGKLKDLDEKFVRWDKLQERISMLEDDRHARLLLRENASMIQEYLRTMVPEKRSMSAIEATPFFESNLASVVKDSPPPAQ